MAAAKSSFPVRPDGRCGKPRFAFVLLLGLSCAGRLAPALHTADKKDSKALLREACPQNYMIGHEKCGTRMLHSHVARWLTFVGGEGQSAEQSGPQNHHFSRYKAPRYQGNTSFPPVDVSPEYLSDFDVPLRIRAFCSRHSDPRFVVTLCDPADRTWAAFKEASRRLSAMYQSNPKSLGYPLDRYTDVGSGSDQSLLQAYERCVRLTVPMVERCLENMTQVQCYRALFGTTSPISGHLIPDALGIKFPCKGMVFNSLYTGQLDHWYGIFKRGAFLVLYMDDWLEDQRAAVAAIADHFSGASLTADFNTSFVPLEPERAADLQPPKETQDSLRRFFHDYRGWKNRVEVHGGEHPEFSHAMFKKFRGNYYWSMQDVNL